MDVGTNKTRKDTRAVVSLVARYRSPNTFEYVEEACCDVSLGGMFIRSKDPAAAGTLLKLECESGAAGAQIRGVARVVWLRPQHSEYGPSGMGVKFVKLDPESRDVITRLVQELAEAGIESPSMSSAPEHRGKPPIKRESSLTPTAAELQPTAAELVAAAPAATVSSSPPVPRELALLHNQRADAVASVPRVSSKPPALPPVSSRPAPSDALLAHATVDSLELSPGPSMRDIGRDLSPLAPVLRSGRISSAPPPPDNDRGRAFWLVAGAVLALGAIVAIFSTRGTREPAPHQEEASVGASPALQAPPPPQAAEPTPEPEPAQPNAAEAANTQPSLLGTDIAAQDTPGSEQIGQAALADNADNPSELAAAAHDNAVVAAAALAPSEVAQVPIVTPTAADAPTRVGRTASATPEGAAPPTASAQPRPASAAQPNPVAAPEAPPPSAAPAVPEVPVLRILPAEPATTPDRPAQPGAAQHQAATQPSANAAPTPPPSAAAPSSLNSAPTSQPTAATTHTAQSGATLASNTPAPSAPPLAAGEVAHVILFTSRPNGASVFVGDQSLVTPAELNLGAMPARVRVTAQKEGFESSTVWINNVTEFQKVGNTMRREVHFVLASLPAAPSATPAQSTPNSTLAQPANRAVAPAQIAPVRPAAPTQAPNAAPSAPASPAIPPHP